MEGSRFDAWTRRGVGLAATGLAGALLALSGIAGTEAKKGKGKRKKKKCTKLGENCNDGKKKCCCGLACREPIVNNSSRRCCKIGGSECSTSGECCSGNCQGNFCFCKGNGLPCGIDEHCCSFNCVSNQCAAA